LRSANPLPVKLLVVLSAAVITIFAAFQTSTVLLLARANGDRTQLLRFRRIQWATIGVIALFLILFFALTARNAP
jgi:hypothetical protein